MYDKSFVKVKGFPFVNYPQKPWIKGQKIKWPKQPCPAKPMDQFADTAQHGPDQHGQAAFARSRFTCNAIYLQSFDFITSFRDLDAGSLDVWRQLRRDQDQAMLLIAAREHPILFFHEANN